MGQVVCIRFTKNAKVEYVSAKEHKLKLGDSVVIETDKGLEIAKVIRTINEEESNNFGKLKCITRVATVEDLKNDRENVEEAHRILKIAKKEAKNLYLNMKFLTADFTLDRTKLTIYFTAEDRVDFRELVRILASEVRTRIELRQIGPRDELKLYCSLGMCGKEVCCRTYLNDFKSITIKDAKEQGLQINMDKLSGACGKLMCCLKYEEEEYKENQKNMPKYNEVVKVLATEETGRVCNLDILNMKVKVKFGDSRENEKFEVFDVKDLSWKEKEV